MNEKIHRWRTRNLIAVHADTISEDFYVCRSEDVSQLEATLAERDAEIERLNHAMKNEIDGDYIKCLEAENAELKKRVEEMEKDLRQLGVGGLYD